MSQEEIQETSPPVERPIRAPGIVFFALLTALFGLGWLWVAGRFKPDSLASDRPELLTYARFLVPMFVIFALGCFASAGGLLFRQRWARYAVLGCSGAWLFIGAISFVSLISEMFTGPKERAGATLVAGVITAAFFVGFPGSYWLYFRRRPIRALFVPRRISLQPVGIKVIGWWLLITGALAIPGLWMFHTPITQVLWMTVRDWPAALALILRGIWSLLAGVGVLRRRAWGWWAAAAFQLFEMTQAIFGAMTPMRYEDVVTASRLPLPPPSPETLAMGQRWGMVPMAGAAILIFVFLLRYRPWFFNQTATEPTSSPNAPYE